MDWWAVIVAIILGLVEGATEFAPVSSTGHMILVDDMILKSKKLFSEPVANTFKVVIQLGSILAVVIVFKQRIFSLLGFGKRTAPYEEGNGSLKLRHIVVGLLPAVVLGFLFEDYIDEHLFSVPTVLIGLVVGAFLMIAADRFAPVLPKTETVDHISYRQAFLIGLFQCLALWPGFSRSGSSISGGVLLGMSHRAAADFTFIMAVPIMAGASALSLIKNWSYFTMDALPFFVAGFISAFVFALLSIRFFLALINKVKLVPFAIYRIVLAGIIYIFFL
ncbi:undecaprenyl-diphosphatase [Bacillus ectoiniformans]|uniref:undecaprenyl-diphosphate phosphatase n=1 Tax=Bacillus ectoiniformans TaxID=1494429 RepID=UPI00195B1DBD|nr:undecaprenyl-diphosphate phosphatase [Bacillus ectoiniformans]MBM7648773.1 undecaprenyl-diphosphatase [Bacillus ectoiniformans]